MMAILAPICSNTSHNLPQSSLHPAHTCQKSLTKLRCVQSSSHPAEITEIES